MASSNAPVRSAGRFGRDAGAVAPRHCRPPDASEPAAAGDGRVPAYQARIPPARALIMPVALTAMPPVTWRLSFSLPPMLNPIA